MILTIKSKIKLYLKENLKIIILLTIIFIAGAAVASLQNFQTTEEEIRLYIKDFFYNVSETGTDFLSTFNASLFGHLKSCAVIFIASLTVIGTPVVLAYTLYCGFSYGTVLACMFKSFGVKTLLIVAGAILPHVIFSLPVYLFYLIFAIKHSTTLSAPKQSLKIMILKPLVFAVIFLLSVSVSSLVQSYIEPFFIKLVAFQFL